MGAYTDLNDTVSFSNLATMIPVHDFSKLHNTHTIQFTGKPFVGISPVGMELMFNEHIRGQYLTLGKT